MIHEVILRLLIPLCLLMGASIGFFPIIGMETSDKEAFHLKLGKIESLFTSAITPEQRDAAQVAFYQMQDQFQTKIPLESASLEASTPDLSCVSVIIDVFRAFTTAAYVLERYPTTYMMTTQSEVISRLASNLMNPLMIGKAEQGTDIIYHIPNSPTRVQGTEITNRNILHRTAAGAKGILLAQNADIVLAVGLVNADATVEYIKTLTNPKITIIPMGHEGTTPSLEDHLCALYMEGLIYGEKINLTPFMPVLREGSGQYFFSEDQWQYPCEDFECCLETGRFDFAIQAMVQDDYAILTSIK